MPQRTLWMHGANMQVEYPNRLTSVRATGPFVRIEGARGQNTWLHFPLPTPAVIDGTRMRIDAALVSFRVREHASVHEIIVYDGDRRIAESMDLDLRGEYPVPVIPKGGRPRARANRRLHAAGGRAAPAGQPPNRQVSAALNRRPFGSCVKPS